MNSQDIYKLTISDKIGGEVFVEKDYCYLSSFDVKVQSSVLFLLSAKKELKVMLKTDLDYFTDVSNIMKYLDKYVIVKDYYGDKTRVFNLKLIK